MWEPKNPPSDASRVDIIESWRAMPMRIECHKLHLVPPSIYKMDIRVPMTSGLTTVIESERESQQTESTNVCINKVDKNKSKGIPSLKWKLGLSNYLNTNFQPHVRICDKILCTDEIVSCNGYVRSSSPSASANHLHHKEKVMTHCSNHCNLVAESRFLYICLGLTVRVRIYCTLRETTQTPKRDRDVMWFRDIS